MKEELKYQGVNFMVPFLIGGVVGAGAALLLAPKSGKEMRDDLKRFATTAKERVVLAVDKGNELLGEAKTAVENVIEAGKTAIVQENDQWLHA